MDGIAQATLPHTRSITPCSPTNASPTTTNEQHGNHAKYNKQQGTREIPPPVIGIAAKLLHPACIDQAPPRTNDLPRRHKRPHQQVPSPLNSNSKGTHGTDTQGTTLNQQPEARNRRRKSTGGRHGATATGLHRARRQNVLLFAHNRLRQQCDLQRFPWGFFPSSHSQG